MTYENAKIKAEELYKKDGEHRESFLGGHFISTFKDCPRSFYFKYIMRLSSQREHSFFILGSALHGGIELFFRGHPQEVCEAYAEVYIEHNILVYKDEERMLKDRHKAPLMIRQWFVEYVRSGIEDRYDFIEAEVEHMISLPNGYPMTVRLDRLMFDKELARYVIFDIKTTSRSLATPINGLKLGDQALMYLYAVKQVYGSDPAGLVADVIYHRDLVGGPKIECTRSQPLTFSPYAFIQWEMNTIAWLSEISQKVKAFKLGTWPEEVLFPRKGGYGCGNCPFNDICRRKINVDELPSGFVRDTWSGGTEAMVLLQSDRYDDRMLYKEGE